MARHKMSLDVNYVSDWGVQEALRELFQNAIDWGNWTPVIRREEGSLDIISHNAVLTNASLLLGNSVKKEGSIGHFGEGYKLAMLVLVRLGYKCKIYTGGEIWIPKLIDSRTYKTKQLVFDTEQNPEPRDVSVSFYVEGLSHETFDVMERRNLHLTPNLTWHNTSKGNILQTRPGEIFIGGLYVCTCEEYKYGYNFNPKCMSIDRDRRIVRDFDLAWMTCQMWKETDDFALVNKLIKDKAPDVKYLDSFIYNADQGFADEAARSFLVEYGDDAVPVSSQSELENAQEERHEKIVLVEPVQKTLILRSSLYITPPPPRPIKSPREMLLDFRVTWDSFLTNLDMLSDLEALILEAERWYKQ